MQDLRIFGAVFTSTALESLRHALKTGFSALTSLEFTVDKQSEAAADRVVQAAKDRGYVGRNGLSVIVNQRG